MIRSENDERFNMLNQGKLVLDSGFIISKDLLKKDIVNQKGRSNVEIRRPNAPSYSNYTFIDRLYEELFAFRIYYYDDEITSFEFSLYNKEDVGEGWDGWSKEKELLINQNHIDFLRKNIGKPVTKWPYNDSVKTADYNFKWGGIKALYDDRSACAVIKVFFE